MKRLFAAIKIHPSGKFLAVYHQMQSLLEHEKINWVAPHNLHLTLKFFGETPVDLIDRICVAIDEAVIDIPPFTLSMKRSGIFGSQYNPRVIWFGFDRSETLQFLFKSMKKNLEDIGIEYDRQNFVPHLTLGRIKFIQDKGLFQKTMYQFRDVDLQKELIEQVYLYESILKPSGPQYEVVEEFILQP